VIEKSLFQKVVYINFEFIYHNYINHIHYFPNWLE